MTRISKAILEDMFETVERTRDELRVQAHLGKEEAKDQWKELEHKWDQVRGKRKQMQEVVGETGEEVFEGVKISLDELRDGYKRIRELL